MLLRDLTDQHSVVCSAAVFKKNREHFPDICNHRVLFLRVLQTVLY